MAGHAEIVLPPACNYLTGNGFFTDENVRVLCGTEFERKIAGVSQRGRRNQTVIQMSVCERFRGKQQFHASNRHGGP
jgi:hypothetical protein